MENIRVLIIGKVWPESNSSAAGSRMIQLIMLFKEQDWNITFASSARESEFTDNLEVLGIKKADIKLNDVSFDSFVKELNPSFVLFDRFMTEEQFGWRVAEQCPGALRILDTEDLHCLRVGRQLALKEERQFKNNDLISDHAKREIASIYRCDLSLIISPIEMGILRDFFRVDTSLLHYLPFMLESIINEEKNKWLPYEERKHFISIGNFLHEPNWDAVRYLKEEIWSKIRYKLPDAELHIYGAYSSDKVFQLHNSNEGFKIKGRAEVVQDVMEGSRVCLAPLRFGAGIKGKLIDAMQCGTPSVTTDIGAEGMADGLEWSGSIQNDVEAFVESAVELYHDKQVWTKAQANGEAIINSIYPKKEIGKKLINRVNEMLEHLPDHRASNFVGTMLLYHSMASTKFMSKWIEEKNKK